jgi:tetratricopeptide (TPR) repeat protein
MRILILFSLILLLTSLSAAIEVTDKGDRMSEPQEINADSLLEEADALFQKRDYQAALEKYTTTAEAARADFNRPVEVEAMAQMARMNLILGSKEEGRTWLEQAAERASDSDPMGWSRYLGVRGRFEWKDDNLAAARKTFDDMYVYCNTNALWGRAVDAAHMIAIVAETPEEQIEWGKRGIEAAEAGNVESWLGPLWNNLGTVYYDQKQFDSALACFLQARDYHWRFSGEIAKLFADYHVGMTYRLLGQYDEAASWLRPVLAWAERLGDHSAIGQACEDLGEIALAKGEKSEGFKLLQRAREEYKAAGFDESWPEIWENINKRIGDVE